MTKDQRIELCDALTAANAAVDRALVLVNMLLDSYFLKFEAGRDDLKICYDFKRQGVFAELLRDQLIAIDCELPSAEWVDGLKCEEASA